MATSIGIMALTATATRSLRLKVEELLGMLSPSVVIRSPDKKKLEIKLSGFERVEWFWSSKSF